MQFDLKGILRENIKNIKPYSSARDEYSGVDGVFLDANENPFGSVANGDFNRYPDPYQLAVKTKLSSIKEVGVDQIFLGNGSDEPIDLLFRAFTEPRVDNVIVMPPTYGMYQVCADINDVKVKQVSLTIDFELQQDEVLNAVDPNTKLIFVCSPNNPTGNLLSAKKIEELLESFAGIVVIDEAYIDFADSESWVTKLNQYPNLVVLQTFSKAWGMAALRIGMAFASSEIISVFNKIKYPYNLNILTQEKALEALANEKVKDDFVKDILEQRNLLKQAFEKMNIQKIYPSDSNSLLIKVYRANEVYKQLIQKLIIVRDRSSVTLCDDCLRITVGTKEENQILIKELNNLL